MEALDWKKLLEENDTLIRDKIKTEIKNNVQLDKRTDDKIIIFIKPDGSIANTVLKTETEIAKIEDTQNLIVAKISPYDIDEWLYYRAWIENKVKDNNEIENGIKEEIVSKHLNEYLEMEANTFIKNTLEKIDFVNW